MLQLAILINDYQSIDYYQELANYLSVPLITNEQSANYEYFLTWRDHCLQLLTVSELKKGGLNVNIDARAGEINSYPASKENSLARAIGRKTKTVIDATTGWGQDSLALWRMGYQLTCIERSPVLAVLLRDGFQRLEQQAWVQKQAIALPQLIMADARTYLSALSTAPDCIYLDPMFPPKRKKSALAKKSMAVLHELIGQDTDKTELFTLAWQITGKRVVVKSPDYAEPLGGKPQESFTSKLVRYDVYLK